MQWIVSSSEYLSEEKAATQFLELGVELLDYIEEAESGVLCLVEGPDDFDMVLAKKYPTLIAQPNSAVETTSSVALRNTQISEDDLNRIVSKAKEMVAEG
jgi:hypothetical protein